LRESDAILCYLAEDTPYLRRNRFERAKVMQWLFFEQNYVEPVIGSLRYWTLTGKLERNAAGVPAGDSRHPLARDPRPSSRAARISWWPATRAFHRREGRKRLQSNPAFIGPGA